MPEQTFYQKFEGYWREPNKSGLPNKSGVYCVYSCTYHEEKKSVTIHQLIYIGESEDIHKRVANHEKHTKWLTYLESGNQLCYSYTLVDAIFRNRVEAALIYKHKPPANIEYKDSFPFDKTFIKTYGDNAKIEFMLDQYILDTTSQFSYSPQEIKNIEQTKNHLNAIINNVTDFEKPFLGGSYKRGTMVKGISDVDVYFRYIGTGNSQAALVKLKKCLTDTYHDAIIKQDKPSILVDFNKIPLNITPYKEDSKGNLSIPDKLLLYWDNVKFGDLEKKVDLLRAKDVNLIELIKILKLWNKNHNKGIKNFKIEENVCALFLSYYSDSDTISDWILSYFKNNSYTTDSNKFSTLIKNNYSNAILKSEWIKFINNQ
ncbi:MAG: hypothetical protein MUC49_22135 [Raineya sp.]|jgi:hypothetical protein|nr:hypothetical protein [Raineya sp.]